MASTTKQEKASKKYYDNNKEYRQKKIKKQIEKQKRNKSKTVKYQKECYHTNETYKEYKKNYAKRYRKENPIKSKPRNERSKTKERN